MTKTLLHISHTDIRTDSRILKEVSTLETLKNCVTISFGVTSYERLTQKSERTNNNFKLINLLLKPSLGMPRIFRTFFALLSILELNIRFTYYGIKIKPKVVHCHDAIVLPAGLLIKKFSACNLIYDAHELESDVNEQTAIFSKYILKVEKVCWPKVDLFVTVSDSIRQWYLHQHGEKKSIVVLNSPEIRSNTIFESQKTLKERGYLRKAFNIPKSEPIFLYTGFFTKGRGLSILLDIFGGIVKDAHFVLVGYGPMKKEIIRYSNECPNIHHHEAVPHEDLVSLASSADYGLCIIENVSLSDYLCLPNKLFEYSFAGIYILGSRFPEIVSLVEQYDLGAHCEVDKPEITNAIKDLVKNRPKFGHKDITELSWQTQGKKLVSAYKGILEIE